MALPVPEAAEALGVAESTLRRWLREGAPQARRGRRGRGRAALVDVQAVRAWRRAEGGEDALRALAGEIPELLAGAMHQAFTLSDGPHKKALAGALAGAWYLAATAVTDRLRRDVSELPEVATVPEKIAALRSIFRDSARVKADSIHPPEFD